MVDSTYTQAVLAKQLKGDKFQIFTLYGVELDSNSGGLGISVGLVDDNDLFKWDIIFEGPSDTIYEVSVCAN